MAKTHVTTLQRTIAYILFTSQILTSCVNPGINAKREELIPITHSTANQHPKQQEIVSETAPQSVAMILSEPKSIPNETYKNSKPAHKLVSRSIPNAPVITALTHQSLPPTQPQVEKRRAQDNALPAPTSLTVQAQQEVHKKIAQTLENPVWKNFLDSQAEATAHLRPVTITRTYEPARIQDSVQQIMSTASNLPIKDGLTIRFVQDKNYWWGVVQETYPGFSRSTALPILYQQSLQINTHNANLVQPTIETLLQLPVEVQQQLVHIFSSNKTLRDAFIYIGEQMGLKGGGFWSRFWSCAASVVVSFAIGFAVGFCTGTFITGVGGLWGGLLLGTIGALSSINYCLDLYRVRKETRHELEQKNELIKKKCEEAIKKAKDKLEEIKKNPEAYKSAIRKDTLRELGQLKKQLYADIKKELEEWGENIKEVDWFFAFSFNLKMPTPYSKDKPCMWEEDFQYLRERIAKRKKDVAKLDDPIKAMKEEFKRQAWEDVKKDREKSEIATAKTKEPYDKAITGIVAQKEWLKEMKDNIASMYKQLQDNVQQYKGWKDMYEGWQKEEYPIETTDEVAKMQEYIEQEEQRLKSLHEDEQLIAYAEQDPHNLEALQQITEKQDLQKALASAVTEGNYWILFYAFRHQRQHASPNMVIDTLGNTLLHRAVEVEEINIIKLCLKYGANKLAKNQYGETPIDLADNNPVIKKLLLEAK